MMNVLEADVLLTAHHLDDQLETIMYRIFNGKSTRNKLGFDELSKRKGYQIYRPLLAVSKKEIKQFQEQISFHILKMNLIKITNMLEMIFVIELFQLLMKIINLKYRIY